MAEKFEREIEDILESLGEIGPKETGWQRLQRSLVGRWYRFLHAVRDLPRAIPADQLMLAAILFIVSAYFLRFVLPNVARVVGLFGLVLFLAAFILSFNQVMRGAGRELRWRGRQIDTGRGQPGFMDQFLLWLRRKLRG